MNIILALMEGNSILSFIVIVLISLIALILVIMLVNLSIILLSGG